MHQGQTSATKDETGRAKKCASFATATIGSKRWEAEKARLCTVSFSHKIGCEHVQEYNNKCNHKPDFLWLFQWMQWISVCTVCTIKIMNAKKMKPLPPTMCKSLCMQKQLIRTVDQQCKIRRMACSVMVLGAVGFNQQWEQTSLP